MKKIFTIVVSLMISMSAFAHDVVVYEPSIVTCAFGIVSSACNLVGSLFAPTPRVISTHTQQAVTPAAIVTTPVTQQAVTTVPATQAAATNPAVVPAQVAQQVSVPAKIYVTHYNELTTPDYMAFNGVLYKLYTCNINGRWQYYYKPVKR